MLIAYILCWAMFVLGGSGITATEHRQRTFAMTTAGLGWDLIRWEVESLSAKATALFQRPAAGLSEEEATALVRVYMERALNVGHKEAEVARITSQGTYDDAARTRLAELEQELAELRVEQEAARPAVEIILQRQVAWALGEAGLGLGEAVLPPVLFMFTEPPRKLIVSPRDRIAMEYTRMVEAGLPLEFLERIEARVGTQPNAVGYVSNVGGLGAYPSMVVDRATLPWVIATVAHEWVHNYLSFFPLGFLYFAGGEITTMNETVADIVGEEIGLMVMRRYYPDLVPTEGLEETTQSPEIEIDAEEVLDHESQGEIGEVESPAPLEDTDSTVEPELPAFDFRFDFREEMRATRLEVDRLLAAGEVEAAEAYMEARRQIFVENGYVIRVLNQAYFAFHGSYATSPASVSPIGPKMLALRAQADDLRAFLHTVRWFTSAADLDGLVGHETLP